MANGMFTPQSSMDFLESIYKPLGVTQDQFGQYSQFLGEIPEELYQLTDPNADIYQQFRQERQGRLSDQLGETYTGLQSSLFQGQREARGMQGRRGFVTGRDFMGEISEAASVRGERAASAFGRGLYDIEEDIVDRVGAERRYVAGLEAQRRSDALRLAELAGLFNQDNRTMQPFDPSEMEEQDQYEDRRYG
tara:strand:- start:1419 stop:1994 length:576 start_codon:yes stop_codon:yes gene_type:complete